MPEAEIQIVARRAASLYKDIATKRPDLVKLAERIKKLVEEHVDAELEIKRRLAEYFGEPSFYDDPELRKTLKLIVHDVANLLSYKYNKLRSQGLKPRRALQLVLRSMFTENFLDELARNLEISLVALDLVEAGRE